MLKIWFNRFINWIVATFVKRPRFWTLQEWKHLNSKEKFWVWYKHHWFLKSSGSSEVDQITTPLKELVLYSGVIITAANTFVIAIGLQVDTIIMNATIAVSLIVLWTVNWFFQWYVGEWKDRKDLITLENEAGNKRQMIFREIRSSLHPIMRRKKEA